MLKCLEGSLGYAAAAAFSELDKNNLVFFSSRDSYRSLPVPFVPWTSCLIRRKNVCSLFVPTTCCFLWPWGTLQPMTLKAPNDGCSLERMIACRHCPVPLCQMGSTPKHSAPGHKVKGCLRSWGFSLQRRFLYITRYLPRRLWKHACVVTET